MSLGFRLYDIAKLLHTSIFVNGSLLNMETWPNCTNERIESFERIEQQYFRKILQAHSKTPIETIYLELGVVPLRYQLMKRRILYLKDVLDRKDNELTKMVVMAQKERCHEGDFYAQVKRDMDKIGVSEEELTESKEMLRDEVTKKMKKHAFEVLISKAKSHSKVHEGAYTDCDGAKHYNNPRFSPDLSNLLFKFRTRTFLVKNNFRNNYRNTNTQCPLCEKHEDDQEHILRCEKIIPHYRKQRKEVYWVRQNNMPCDVMSEICL